MKRRKAKNRLRRWCKLATLRAKRRLNRADWAMRGPVPLFALWDVEMRRLHREKRKSRGWK